MTPEQRLALAHHILSSDAAFESDCVLLDVQEKRPVTEREKSLASVVSDLYRIIHPACSLCDHPYWEANNHRLYKLMNDEKKGMPFLDELTPENL